MSIISGQQNGGAGSSAQGSDATGNAGSQGTGLPAWRASLPEDIRSEKAFDSIKGNDWAEVGPSIAKQFLHAQRMVGTDKLVIPGEKATPEERAAFYNKLGRPEKPDGYQYKLPEGMTEDKLDKTRIDKWRGKFHELGLSKTAADTILSEFISDEHSIGAKTATDKLNEIAGWETTLRQEFGAKFDEKANLARYAAQQFASPELVNLLESTGLGSHPEVVKMFANLGERLGDDRQRGTGGSTGNFAPRTAAEAQAALNSFNLDQSKQKALWDRNDPNHDSVVTERRRLFELAFPKMSAE